VHRDLKPANVMMTRSGTLPRRNHPRPDPGTRTELVTQLRDRLSRHGAPRLQLLVIVLLAGCAAFLVSAGSLRLGLSSMALRYPLAAACGYVTFIGFIRLWIAWQRGQWDPGEPDLDVLDFELPSTSASDAVSLFRGGRSGGAGASDTWAGGMTRSAPSRARAGRFSIDLDLDDLWWLVLAAVCAAGGLIAMLYVVYSAPVLLAEVALDGAVVTALYRRLRREDASHWAATTLRRTWIPAVVLVVFSLIGGFAFERIAPDAQSIGGVIRALGGDGD
jgi:hypothetical protein